MRVLFASTRSAGHFQPLLPFMDACRRGGHDVLVVGPPALAEPVRQAGYALWPGAAPPEDELARVMARIATLSHEEAERVVMAKMFATLNVRAMLAATRAAVRDWRPDVIVRESAEMASAVVAEETGVPHAQVGIGLIATHTKLLSLAAEAVDAWRTGLTGRLAAAPYLTRFPAALEDPDIAGPPVVHRFRDAADAPAPLPDWWNGDRRPLVYITFGSVAAREPAARPVYERALEAVAGLDARVLLTTGKPADPLRLMAPGAHVHVADWVPQAAVLRHANVVVCHGGSGTTVGTLAAGVPLVVTPLFADQPYNARRVAAVGAGVVVEPGDVGAIRSAVDPGALRAAITTVLTNDQFARAARSIAADVRRLPPVDDAVAVLHAMT